MVLQHLGHAVSVQQILAVHSSFTDIAEIENLCVQFGLAGTAITSGLFDTADHLAIALIHDNANADPSLAGPYYHYIVVYGQDASNVYAANPWGGRLATYPLSQFNPAYIAAVTIPINVNTVGASSAGSMHMDADVRAAFAAADARAMQIMGYLGDMQKAFPGFQDADAKIEAAAASIKAEIDKLATGGTGSDGAAIADLRAHVDKQFAALRTPPAP